jgi:hypothetical protein
MARFELDKRQVDRFAERLRDEMPEVAKEATAAALTRTAAGCALFARKEVRKKFTLRNKWTLRSINSTKASSRRRIDRQFALAGSRQAYMAKQEVGGRLPRTKQGRRLTTSEGSREGKTAHPRKKLARGRRKAKNIKLSKQPKVKARGVNRIAFRRVMKARKEGQKFLFLRMKKRNRAGIFEIQKRRIVMVHRIIDEPLRVKKRPWLKPAVLKSRRIAPKVFKTELEKRFRPG